MLRQAEQVVRRAFLRWFVPCVLALTALPALAQGYGPRGNSAVGGGTTAAGSGGGWSWGWGWGWFWFIILAVIVVFAFFGWGWGGRGRGGGGGRQPPTQTPV